MEYSTIISLLAVIVGLGSLLATRSSARTSHRALEHAIEVHDKAERKEYERVKTDLLCQISDSRATLEELRLAIGTERANFGAEPQAVRALLQFYESSLFEEYYNRLEEAVRHLDILWNDVSAWTNEKPYEELMHPRAELYRCRANDETARSSGMWMLGEYRERLAKARARVLSESRQHCAKGTAGTP